VLLMYFRMVLYFYMKKMYKMYYCMFPGIMFLLILDIFYC